MNEKLVVSEIKRTPLLVEFTQELEKELAQIQEIRWSISSCLHRLKDTNYPIDTCGSENMDKKIARGNSDLEETLFRQLESVQQIRKNLQIDLNKIEELF